MLRTFIAVDVSQRVRSRAADLIDRLRTSGVKVTWTKPENLHLTLKFLGDTPETQIPDVCRVAEQTSAEFGPIKLTFRGAGAFPRTARPRTVWIGVEEEGDELSMLQETLQDRLYDLGFAKEHRRFKPHLTLGRVRGGGPAQKELGQLIEENDQFDAGSCMVEEVVTYASYLEKTGAVHQVLGRAPFGGPPA